MAWFIQVLELADEKGTAVGKFRLTARSDEDGGGPFGLCDHEHDDRAEADACPEARKRSEFY